MSIGLLISVAVGLLVVFVLGFVIYRRIPKKLKAEQFIGDWKQLQVYCRDKATWPQAIADADKLLDKALKKRKYKGKSMGERMVSAQRVVDDNDRLWFAHNLAKKIVAEPAIKLKEIDVKNALIGFRGALKDIGAMRAPEPVAPVEETQAKK